MSCASVEHFYSLHPRGQRRRPDWWRRRPSGGGQPSSERTPSGRYLPANASRVHWRRFALLRGKESASRTFKFCSECGRALRYCGLVRSWLPWPFDFTTVCCGATVAHCGPVDRLLEPVMSQPSKSRGHRTSAPFGNRRAKAALAATQTGTFGVMDAFLVMCHNPTWASSLSAVRLSARADQATLDEPRCAPLW